jgi:tetratricopeptide (TPR) repeat protein
MRNIGRLSFLALALLVILTACRLPPAEELLRSGRQHIEASECEGVDRYTEAISDLQSALVADPNETEAYYWLYLAYDRSGDAEQAATVLSDLEDAVEAEVAGQKSRFWLFQSVGLADDVAARSELLEAMETAVQASPGDADVHFWLGRAYYESGEFEAALESFQSAVTMDSEHKLAHFWLGQLYTERGQFQEALQEFSTVIELDPDSAAAYHNYSVVAYQLGNLDEAESYLQDALENDPDDPRSHYQLGAIHLAQALPEDPLSLPDSEALERAQSEFETALELCPSMLEPLIGLGNLYLIEGNPSTALEYLNQVVEQAPDSPEAWFALGQTYASVGQMAEACDAFAEFINLSPPAEWVDQAEQIRVQLGCE